ncbi:Gfo/Idh/MocA family oxidoreductase [Anaerocolumna sp. AGMB13025]|uniref:Gfo/Idh/MocA family protein n=1 Tax=Anaerocolumna sp. AGMB13025 TaxID=3039116 RepID=UPI00241BF5F6|nr:Gfo/Idh/MocA family oxidoreductase [Anaerocolumna sp. AGMB13025]WFR56284.1 Gfo/Idh/MocA family oxidoreductase [Anaerocolumna sp. AGMB13025]
MFKVALISKWHVHAQGYAEIIKSFPDAEITCVWDEEPERGREWAMSLGVQFEEDMDKLLAREDVEGILICSPTSLHTEIMKKAAQAGKHIFTEKAMALTKKECEEITAEVKKAGVKFAISFPARTTPTNLYAKSVIDAGLVGKVNLLRIRNGHDGALNNWLPEYWYDETKAGGGAMMDLGCHPMYLSSWILGKPVRISSMFSHFTERAVEDNSVCTIEFENHAVAIVETSLVTYKTPSMVEVYGTEGTLIICDNMVKLTSKKMDEEFNGWVTPSKLPEALPHPLRQWVDGVLYNKPILFDAEAGTRLTELLEAAYIANKEKREVQI